MKKTLFLLLLSISCYSQDVIRQDLIFVPKLRKLPMDYISKNWKLLNKLPNLSKNIHSEKDTVSLIRYYYVIDLKNEICKVIGVEETDRGIFHFDPIYIKEKTYP